MRRFRRTAKTAPLAQHLNAASQASSLLIGGLIILTGVTILSTGTPASEVAGWAWEVLGLTFIALLASLVFTCLLCWLKVRHAEAWEREPWLVGGVQAANGIATIALTYTLLGISLGIGGLAGQELTPDTVQGVIQDLTKSFSMAFMTTVIGLPTSAALRALLLVAGARADAAMPVAEIMPPPDR